MGKREAGSGRREAGSGRREAGGAPCPEASGDAPGVGVELQLDATWAHDGALVTDDLRKPLAKAGDLIDRLAAAPLDDTPRTLVTSLGGELTTLRAIVDGLPKLPPGASPRRR